MASRRVLPIALPEGAKSLGVKLPAGATNPPWAGDRLPAGTVIVRCQVPGRPVPWSVPPKIRCKNPALVAWQGEVHHRVALAMDGRRPYGGPVVLRLEFTLAPRGNRRPPDITNLVKGCEDAIQGAAILNDSQVRETHAERKAGPAEGVLIVVEAAKGEG
jgi:Holliday junction resolvase RusA-like endonuclease